MKFSRSIYSKDDYICKSRRFDEIKNDIELIKYAEKLTNYWTDSNYSFATFFLNDIKDYLTDNELNRLKELQILYKNLDKFADKVPSNTEVILFLYKQVEKSRKQCGIDIYYNKLIDDTYSTKYFEYTHNQVIELDSRTIYQENKKLKVTLLSNGNVAVKEIN